MAGMRLSEYTQIHDQIAATPRTAVDNRAELHKILKPCNEYLVKMSPLGLTLGLVCLVGTIVSALPQHLKIMRTKTVMGLSPLSLMIGNIALLTNFLNSVILKWKQVEKCSDGFWKCQPSLILLYSNFVIFAGMLPVYYWLVIMPDPAFQRLDRSFRAIPQDANEEGSSRDKSENHLNRQSSGMKRSLYHVRLSITWNCQLFGSILLIAGAISWSLVQSCTHPQVVVAGSLGFFSGLCQAIRFVPQLYKSIVSGGSGSVSYFTFLLQGLGGFLNVYFQIFVSKEQLTTWLPLVISNCFQVSIIFVNIINDIRFRRCWWNKSSQENPVDSTAAAVSGELKRPLL